MFRRFVAQEIDRPFTVYCDDYTDGYVSSEQFVEVQFSGEWCNCFCGKGCRDTTAPLKTIVKITYTYYDWLKKKRVNQVVYKRQ